MPESTQYIPVSAPIAEPVPPAGGGAGRIGVWFFAAASLILFSLSGLVAWRWLDANLLHWGVADSRTTEVNHAELLERVRAFELGTIKHTYSGNAHVDAAKALNAGPARVSLPGWIAGQSLDVKGKTIVTAGVDLSKIAPEDMQVTREGKDARVVITLPAPEILSAELVPDTLDMDTGAGLLTRITTALGVSEKDLRDRAADQIVAVSKESALEQGILDDAAREAELRLQRFLNSLPQSGDGRTTYLVQVRPPAQH